MDVANPFARIRQYVRVAMVRLGEQLTARFGETGSWESGVVEEPLPGGRAKIVAQVVPLPVGPPVPQPVPPAMTPLPTPPPNVYPSPPVLPLPLVESCRGCGAEPVRRGGRPPEVKLHVLAFLLRGGRHHHSDVVEAMRLKGHSASSVNENLRALVTEGFAIHDAVAKTYQAAAPLLGPDAQSSGG